MPPSNTDADTSSAKPARKHMKSIIIVLAIILLEAGLFTVWIVLDGPSEAEAGMGTVGIEPMAPAAETMILEDCRAPNRRSGRLYMYDIQIGVVTDQESASRARELRDQREALIRDRLRTIVARAEPKYFDEPDLQTLKRQIGEMLTEVFGEGTIKEVLIPRCNGYIVE